MPRSSQWFDHTLVHIISSSLAKGEVPSFEAWRPEELEEEFQKAFTGEALSPDILHRLKEGVHNASGERYRLATSRGKRFTRQVRSGPVAYLELQDRSNSKRLRLILTPTANPLRADGDWELFHS